MSAMNSCTSSGASGRWSREEDELLRRLRRRGWSIRHIAERLSRSPLSIRSRNRRLNIPRKPRETEWPEERTSLLRRLWAEGYSASRIAREINCGVTRCAVLGKVHRLRFPGRATAQCARPPVSIRRGPARKRLLIVSDFAPQIIEEAESVDVDIDDDDIPASQRRQLLELTEEHCRWPVGDPSSGDFFFCGGVASTGTPYCRAHCCVAYRATREAYVSKSTANA